MNFKKKEWYWTAKTWLQWKTDWLSYVPSCELTYPLPMVLMKMIFLFPRSDMASFRGGYLETKGIPTGDSWQHLQHPTCCLNHTYITPTLRVMITRTRQGLETNICGFNMFQQKIAKRNNRKKQARKQLKDTRSVNEKTERWRKQKKA